MTDHPEWAVACPHCRARPWQRCTTINGRRLTIPSHDARHTAWNQTRDQQTGEPE